MLKPASCSAAASAPSWPELGLDWSLISSVPGWLGQLADAWDIINIPSMRPVLALIVLWGTLEDFRPPPGQVAHLQSCHWNAEAASLQSLVDVRRSYAESCLTLLA